MNKIEDMEWFCTETFMNTLVYRIVAPMSCCVMKEWPKGALKRKYETADPKKLHNKDEYLNFRNEHKTDKKFLYNCSY